MSVAVALDYNYQYPFLSVVGKYDKGFGLQLATCGANQEHPYFFEGKLIRPRCIGDMLLVLSNVVRTHFFLHRIPLMDPVVTSNESMLRFEGFSGCCGAYARVDLLPEAFESELQNRGTTNVDFNNSMRSSLSRLRDQDETRLSVGMDEVKLTHIDKDVVEKKVKLPIRWIKGFSEVQAYQLGLKLKYEISISEARRFVRSLPRGGTKQPVFVSQFGKSLRISYRENSNAIRLTGLDRVRIIEPLLGSANKLRIWYDVISGTSGWEIINDIGRFFLMISPELYRGFSGEGQILEKFAVGNWQKALPDVQAQLTWDSQINCSEISKKTGINETEVLSALAVLGSRGVAGYDIATQSYFHRVLPFELDKIELLQPRLKNARKLLEDKKVNVIEQLSSEKINLSVAGSGVTHTVRLDNNIDKCTCPWFNKYQGKRGPCKHILAARMFMEEKGEMQ